LENEPSDRSREETVLRPGIGPRHQPDRQTSWREVCARKVKR
jgi:hypothetical protein